MSQPQYTQDAVRAMTDNELAAELREWGRARQHVSKRRLTEGKEPLDYQILLEAADRLTVTEAAPIVGGVIRRALRGLGRFIEILVRGSVPPWRES